MVLVCVFVDVLVGVFVGVFYGCSICGLASRLVNLENFPHSTNKMPQYITCNIYIYIYIYNQPYKQGALWALWLQHGGGHVFWASGGPLPFSGVPLRGDKRFLESSKAIEK